MIPYFVIDQITLGPIKLYTWGLFVGLGFGAGYLWFYYLARQKELAPAKIAGLALAIFAGAILGAKILAWALAGGGAMFIGGLLGAIVCGWKYVKILNSPHPNPVRVPRSGACSKNPAGVRNMVLHAFETSLEEGARKCA